MELTIKKLEKSIVELTIEETTENVAKFRKKAMNEIRKNADIKGFRKGAHIPDDVLLKNYKEEYIAALTVEQAIDELYREALTTNNLIPTGQADLVGVESQSPLKFTIKVEVFPEAVINPEYKKIKLTKTATTVEDSEVENALADIQNRFTKFVESTDMQYLSVLGDKVYIDTKATDENGVMLPSTVMDNYPITIGSKILVPGFEEGLVGKKSGEEFNQDVKFPADYHNKDFAGKTFPFTIKINKIETAVKPELTPEFIEQLRGKKTDLEGFKKMVKEEITESKEMNARIKDEEKLLDELLKLTTLEIGDNMIAHNTQKVYQEIKQNIAQSGAKPADYIASLGMDEETYLETAVKPIALKRLQSEIILNTIQNVEKVEVKDEEMNSEIDKIISRYENADVVKRLKDLYIPGTKYFEELKARLAYKNIVDSFFN